MNVVLSPCEDVSPAASSSRGASLGASLGDQEDALLRVLVERIGKVVPRSELARRAGLRDMQPRRVDVLLVAVRRHVGATNLVNVRGRGWMLLQAPEAPSRF